MNGYIGPIEQLTTENDKFWSVLYTAKFSQLVLMTLNPGEEIGDEVHEGDQFFRFEHGQGRVVIDGVSHDVTDGDAVIVPAGARHNIINASASDTLKLYTLYSPPHHRDQVQHQTKADALADTEEFDGTTTE